MQDSGYGLRRIPLLRTPVNRLSPEMRQASWAGNISVVLQPFLKWKRGLGKEKTNVSAAEENKASFRRYLEEAWNQSNLEVVDEIFDRYLSHQPDGSTLERGPEDVKRFVGEFRSAFPDLRMSSEEQIAEGDKVVSYGTIRGTHQGEFRGLAPTGEETEIKGMAVFRFSSEGKVVESWDSYDQLSLMRQSIEQELRMARSIQQALLPQDLLQLEGWQITPYYQPAREVGGDFYDLFELEDGRVGVVEGDATGKGMPAALVASATCSVLRAVAQALGSSSPGEVLSRGNETLLARIPPNMFVTCFYAVLEPQSGSLRYANAGHDLPYLWRGGEAEELRARGMPLGLLPGMEYEEKEIEVDAGEGVLFYTDGLVEAHDPKGEMFGFPRLRELVAEHGEERLLGDFLLDELYSFVGAGWEQEDDITLLTLKRSEFRN
jgi:serine phosphatase RsbU (regulator of sigma subunit)